jgi:hypothetical protein
MVARSRRPAQRASVVRCVGWRRAVGWAARGRCARDGARVSCPSARDSNVRVHRSSRGSLGLRSRLRCPSCPRAAVPTGRESAPAPSENAPCGKPGIVRRARARAPGSPGATKAAGTGWRTGRSREGQPQRRESGRPTCGRSPAPRRRQALRSDEAEGRRTTSARPRCGGAGEPRPTGPQLQNARAAWAEWRPDGVDDPETIE